MMTYLVAILLSTIVAWFILRPHFVASASEEVDFALNAEDTLLEKKDRYLQMLRDLELDYATSKLSTADYELTKHELSLEMAKIIQELDAKHA